MAKIIFLAVIAALLTAFNYCEVYGQPSAEPGGKMVFPAWGAELRGGTRFGGIRGEISWITGFENDGAAAVFTVEIEESGFFALNFITSTIGGYKANTVTVDGVPVGTVSADSDGEFADSILPLVYLEAGTREIGLLKFWGWINLRSLEVIPTGPIPREMFNVSARLINPNADENARRLMSFLADMYGEKILTGQYSDRGYFGFEFQAIRNITGKTPAILGLDMMDYTPSRVARGTRGRAVEFAKDFHERGGIVTMCWHWNVPTPYITGTWYRAFYTYATDIDLGKIMGGDDPAGMELLLADIDHISGYLATLRDAGVPILWRPLHEAAGGWFWWGAAGADAYIELWKLMYDRMTNMHNLTNLIWLWNGECSAWYPGDEYVDIIGWDIYAGERVYSSQLPRFAYAVAIPDSPKIVVLSENGTLFDIDLAIRDGAMWGFFATWSGDFVLVHNALNRYSERFTEAWMLEKVYHHERTLTLESLPDLRNYPIRICEKTS